MPAPTEITPDQTMRIEALNQIQTLVDNQDTPCTVDELIAYAGKVYDFIHDGAAPLDLTPTPQTPEEPQ